MKPRRGKSGFHRLLFSSGIEVPVRTRVEVITPVLSELDSARLRRIKAKGCTVEIFLFGEQHLSYRQIYGREFPYLLRPGLRQ